MDDLKRHKNTIWYLLTTVSQKKRKYQQDIVQSRKRSRKKNLKSECRERERRRALEEGIQKDNT